MELCSWSEISFDVVWKVPCYSELTLPIAIVAFCDFKENFATEIQIMGHGYFML
jgi:hypothetical protein